MENKPKIGSVWQHHNGILYSVVMFTNVGGAKERYPETIVYRNVQTGAPYSRPLNDWSRSMTLVANPSNMQADSVKANELVNEMFGQAVRDLTPGSRFLLAFMLAENVGKNVIAAQDPDQDAIGNVCVNEQPETLNEVGNALVQRAERYERIFNDLSYFGPSFEEAAKSALERAQRMRFLASDFFTEATRLNTE